MVMPSPPPLPCMDTTIKNKSSGKDIIYLSDKDIILDFWESWTYVHEETSASGQLVDISVFPFSSVLQHGPTCGLACIAMVTTMRKLCSIDFLLNIAKEKKFSKCGEMFNTGNMVSLISLAIGDFCFVEHMVCNMASAKEEIISDLINGCSFFLFAYDADKNNEPALKRGQKAHWALACGATRTKDNTCYLLCRQGKSKHLGIWLFDEVDKSNQNLLEISPELSEDMYLLDNISCSLANQYIKITPHEKLRTLNISTFKTLNVSPD